MKPRAWAWFFTVAVAATSVRAQGTFQNLDFEAARLVFLGPGSPLIATTNALPGWTATFGTSQLSQVSYVGGIFGSVELLGLSGSAIDGSFSAVIGGDATASASIRQTGLVPTDARSLQFKVKFSGAVPNEMEVWLGAESLALVPLGAPRGYFLVGADISSFAGQTETLSFSGGLFALDDIEFSPQLVPEPSVLALAGAAASLLLCRRKRS